ncbi:hypothetical protein SAMN05421743_11053 [Thalassobacillus cyri]|uniref:Uncharacterized protein n=1 Tax=Thalassobacillus cyri TaxID=571932 RepID=A0A1H4EZM2_9BACI|nr:hypothetical protein SAMN05421743_11053 [Thalassobacillus cyri]
MRYFSKMKIGSKTFSLTGVYVRECSIIKITATSHSLHRIGQLLEEPLHLWRLEFEGEGYRESIRGKFSIEMYDNFILLKNFRNFKLKHV